MKAKKYLESDKSETYLRYQRENKEVLKSTETPKKQMMMIQLILILIKRQIMKNQRKYIGQKKLKK